jgi:drug/metabolite transporter (DMT)-like permease
LNADTDVWPWLWVPVTIVAAALQVGRNAIQRGLTEELGTLGATQVRFLFGLPFACVFFLLAWWLTKAPWPTLTLEFLLFTLVGASAQITATALMLAAMRLRDFVVVTVWIKTEPLQIALFGVLVLSDPLGLGTGLSIGVATLGVLWMAYRPRQRDADGASAYRPVLLGLAAAAAFAVAAVGFRGAILSLPDGNFLVRASWALVCGLFFQSLVLAVWLTWRDPATWRRCLNAWRVSIAGGFLGAAGSQAWFIGFALTTAANVRTLALVEVFFAHFLSKRFFDGHTSTQEKIGMALILVGVVGLLWLQT